MTRTRNNFPPECDFTGWWVKSKHGKYAQLQRRFRDISGALHYALVYRTKFIHEGNGMYLLSRLLKEDCVIRRTKEELKDVNNWIVPKLIPAVKEVQDTEPAQATRRPGRRIHRGK